MSGFPKIEMSSQYTYISAAMAEVLGEIMKQDYSVTHGRIPPAVLNDAEELFSKAINVMNGHSISDPVGDAVAYSMIIHHLRQTNPKRYGKQKPEKDRLLYRRDIRNLASLISNLRLPKVPEDQREFVPPLKRFFELLSETGEEARYQEVTSGEPPEKYTYS